MEKVSMETIKRLPMYLRFLKEREEFGDESISSTVIARKFSLTSIQVRKDLASISVKGGRPKTGFPLAELIEDIEEALGIKSVIDAVIVGGGNLGHAILFYRGFLRLGLNIVAVFDSEKSAIEKIKAEGFEKAYHVDELERIVSEKGATAGILTLPSAEAQAVSERLFSCGVLGFWNFTSAKLELPPFVAVKNEDLSASLAVFSRAVLDAEKVIKD